MTDKLRTAAQEALRWFQAGDDEQSAFKVMQELHAALHPDEPPLELLHFDDDAGYLDARPAVNGEWMTAFSDPQGVHFYRGHGRSQWEALVKLYPFPPTWNVAVWDRQLSLRERIKFAKHFGSARGIRHSQLWAVRQALHVERWPEPND